ncbi:galactose oxidase [Leptospira interrogans serovar Ricardi]|uniref:galactose oxidase n=1 Tax=Leptospira interrogans TaxID=173 RepID=UPI0021592DBB|nr:galactose oxidase [Leptospira interrogans]MCR8640867.1 galactose oxidase [Leptospira interrogans serovar Ricardi]
MNKFQIFRIWELIHFKVVSKFVGFFLRKIILNFSQNVLVSAKTVALCDSQQTYFTESQEEFLHYKVFNKRVLNQILSKIKKNKTSLFQIFRIWKSYQNFIRIKIILRKQNWFRSKIESDSILKRRNIFSLILYLSIFPLSNCLNSPLSNIHDAQNEKVTLAFVSQIGPRSATITWECSHSLPGSILYGKSGLESVVTSLENSKVHSMTLPNLESNTDYLAFVFCSNSTDKLQSIPLTFKTWISDFPNRTRGLWVIGGMGADASPVREIDFFDPVTSTWYPSATSIPTPRVFANIVSHKNKIYVIGGMEKQGINYVASKKTEVYDPYLDQWTTLSDMPVANQGGVIASVGEEIFIISGTTTNDMTTGTILNTVSRLAPGIGQNGLWQNYLSLTAIFSRVDMSGCGLNGNIFFTGGRFTNDGTPQATSDSFSPSINSTSAAGEPSITIARHGAGSTCVKPLNSDPYPTDPEWIAVIGGSTGTSTLQPITSITTSNRTDFYQNGMVAFAIGPILPVAVYFPGVEASYETRKLFVFGGASALNIPTDSVYSIGLQNPIASNWSLDSLKMPRARYAHKVIRIDR